MRMALQDSAIRATESCEKRDGGVLGRRRDDFLKTVTVVSCNFKLTIDGILD